MKTVLIIDDDQTAVRFLSILLEENGFEAKCAYDGKEGLEKIKELRPDLVVLDVMMPKKSGFTLFRQLRKDEEFKDLPVLMMTGVAAELEQLDNEKEDADQRPFDALREGLRKGIKQMREEGLVRPDMFLDKPVEPDLFISRIKALLEGT